MNKSERINDMMFYLNKKNQFNLKDITEKYGISNQYVLRGWIKRYKSGKGNSRMKQGRQTTFEEGVEIVTFTIACDKDDQAAIDKYGISYQQVYSWVRKFEKQGSLGLEDRRGKGLESKPNLTTEEELQLKIKQLEEGNCYLEMEKQPFNRSLWLMLHQQLSYF